MFDLGNFLGKLSDIGKIPTKVVAFVWLSSGAVLILPDEALDAIRLQSFSAELGTWIGLAFLLSSVFLALNLGNWGVETWRRKQAIKSRRQRILQALQSLDSVEKAVLREFYIQERNAIRLPVTEAAVAGLAEAGVLVRVGSIGQESVAGLVFMFAISDDARDGVTPELVEFIAEPSNTERERIVKARPHFIRELQQEELLNAGPEAWFRGRL